PVLPALAAAEPPPRAGQDQGPRALAPVHPVGHLLVHLDGEAVEAVGTVERQPGDPAFDGEEDGSIGHYRPLALAAAQINSILPLALSRAVPLSLDSHGAVHFHHRRRGLIAWQGPDGGVARGASPGPRLYGPPEEARSLSQRRSRHDEPLPARRSLRHRRRRRDRPRSRP